MDVPGCWRQGLSWLEKEARTPQSLSALLVLHSSALWCTGGVVLVLHCICGCGCALKGGRSPCTKTQPPHCAMAPLLAHLWWALRKQNSRFELLKAFKICPSLS